MPDPYRIMEAGLDVELEALKTDLIAHARKLQIEQHVGEGIKLEATLEVDVDAVLRASTSTRVVRQVQRTEGEEDHTPIEESRK